MSRRGLIAVILFIAILVLLVMIIQRPSAPSRIGATVDDVWSYIHTGGVSEASSGTLLPITKRTRWVADVTTIQSQTRHNWNKRLFAVQNTVYTYSNGIVIHVDSDWDMHWPF